MVDLILVGFTVAIFAGGFWCGKTYGTFDKMLDAIKAKVFK